MSIEEQQSEESRWRSILDRVREGYIEGHFVSIVSVENEIDRRRMGAEFDSKYPFVATYVDESIGRHYFLYGRGEVDLSRIAREHGGSGTKETAQFTVGYDHPLVTTDHQEALQLSVYTVRYRTSGGYSGSALVAAKTLEQAESWVDLIPNTFVKIDGVKESSKMAATAHGHPRVLEWFEQS